MKQISRLAFLLCVLSSCSHQYYIPNVQNVPLFKEKNEARLNIASGSGDETNTTEVQGAYSITDHIGLIANYIYAKGGAEKNDNGKGSLMEIGAGYFFPLQHNLLFEIYGGGGAGKETNYYYDHYDSIAADVYRGSWTIGFSRFFIQPAVGFTTKWFDVAFSPRFSLLHFNGNGSAHSLSSDEGIDDRNYIRAHKTHYFFEPGITIRGGWKYVKVQLQYVRSLSLNSPNLDFSERNFSAGIYFSLAKRYNHKKESD